MCGISRPLCRSSQLDKCLLSDPVLDARDPKINKVKSLFQAVYLLIGKKEKETKIGAE